MREGIVNKPMIIQDSNLNSIFRRKTTVQPFKEISDNRNDRITSRRKKNEQQLQRRNVIPRDSIRLRSLMKNNAAVKGEVWLSLLASSKKVIPTNKCLGSSSSYRSKKKLHLSLDKEDWVYNDDKGHYFY